MVRFLDPEIVKMDDSFSGSRNRQNGAISGSRNPQNGRQILYVSTYNSKNSEIDEYESSGIQNLKNILTENRQPLQTTPKTVKFSSDVEEITQIQNNSSSHISKQSRVKEVTPGKFQIRLDEKSNMSKLADHIIPQLNTMQKNYLGLLFFNELSENIVEDMVTQELSKMDESQLESVIVNLDQKVHDTAAPILMNCVSEEVRTVLVCDAFDALKTEEKAALVFTAGQDAVQVCSSVAGYGGRGFKKSLIRSILAGEDTLFRDQIFQELRKHQSNNIQGNRSRKIHSEDEENYSSAEETLADRDMNY
jgi:hypothetical protein